MAAYCLSGQESAVRFRLFLLLCLTVSNAYAGEVSLVEAALECRNVEKDTQRLACYDRLPLDDAPDSVITEAVTATAVSVDASDRADAEGNFGFEFSVKDAAESLESEVTEVRKNAKGGLVVTLANGQVWQQTDSQRLFLSDGDSVTLYRGAFSAFYLAVDGKGRRYRFARVK
jgi:hypothetical protein